MTNPYTSHLRWIETEQDEMLSLLEAWVNTNSYTLNEDGVRVMLPLLIDAFTSLGGEIKSVALPAYRHLTNEGRWEELPLGDALIIRKRPHALFHILLGGHFDTVYPPESPFQKMERTDPKTLKGPGITDMKGGLMVMLKALQAFEQSPFCANVGWEILLTPDEEIGSPGSSILWKDSAMRSDIGLLFEPCLSDGSLVSSRKGSANYTLICRGRAAHAGRDFHEGRNAILALAQLLMQIQALPQLSSDTTINTGFMHGGGPVNVVPDHAFARINVRANQLEELEQIDLQLRSLIEKQQEGIAFTLHGAITRPPKPFDKTAEALYQSLAFCGGKLGLSLKWQPSGGVCDGNLLAGAGLPTIDTLGVQGGGIHSPLEYMSADSLLQRSQLTALFLMMIGNKDIKVQGKTHASAHR